MMTNLEEAAIDIPVTTTTIGSDDPFAPREGKTLLWRNVNMVLVRNDT